MGCKKGRMRPNWRERVIERRAILRLPSQEVITGNAKGLYSLCCTKDKGN